MFAPNSAPPIWSHYDHNTKYSNKVLCCQSTGLPVVSAGYKSRCLTSITQGIPQGICDVHILHNFQKQAQEHENSTQSLPCASRKETTVVAREEEVVCVHLPWVVDNIIIGYSKCQGVKRTLPPATLNRTPAALQRKVRSRTIPGIFTPFK